MRASSATWRARSGLLTQALVRPGVGAVTPIGGSHRPLAFRLHFDELQGAISGADAQAVELAGRQAVAGASGPPDLETLASEGRPGVTHADQAVHLVRRPGPLDVVLFRVDLVGVGGFSVLRRRRAESSAQRIDQKLSAGIDQPCP